MARNTETFYTVTATNGTRVNVQLAGNDARKKLWRKPQETPVNGGFFNYMGTMTRETNGTWTAHREATTGKTAAYRKDGFKTATTAAQWLTEMAVTVLDVTK